MKRSRNCESSPGGVPPRALRDTGRVARIVAATGSPGAALPRLRLRAALGVITGAGLVLVVVGSFLPWVISGTVKRSSYQIVGVIDRLGIAGDGIIAVLADGWPLLGVLCVTPVVAAALRWWRTAGALAALIGLVAAALSLGLLVLALGRTGLTVRLDPIGPSVMAAGGLLLVGGGLCLTFGNSSPERRRSGRSTAVNQS